MFNHFLFFIAPLCRYKTYKNLSIVIWNNNLVPSVFCLSCFLCAGQVNILEVSCNRVIIQNLGMFVDKSIGNRCFLFPSHRTVENSVSPLESSLLQRDECTILRGSFKDYTWHQTDSPSKHSLQNIIYLSCSIWRTTLWSLEGVKMCLANINFSFQTPQTPQLCIFSLAFSPKVTNSGSI